MPTVINNPPPQGDGGFGVGLAVTIIIVILLVFFFIYGLPRIRGGGTNINNPQINIPSRIEIQRSTSMSPTP
jgi:hypothetical protein